jgi:hypothetical protein
MAKTKRRVSEADRPERRRRDRERVQAAAEQLLTSASRSQVSNPATNVASGLGSATSS